MSARCLRRITRHALWAWLSVAALGACDAKSTEPYGGDAAPTDAGLDVAAFLPGSGSEGGGVVLCTASITAAVRAEVDIVLLVDSSLSMEAENDEVRDNLNTFARAVGRIGIDSRVVVLAEKAGGASGRGVCIPPPLGGELCADRPPQFHHVNLTIGSDNALSQALDHYARWRDFLRPSALKVFIVITDDDSKLPWDVFDRELLAKEPSGMFGTPSARRYVFDSVCGWATGTPLLDPTPCATAMKTGENYQRLSQLTSGLVASVCESSFAGVFDHFARGLGTSLGCSFRLPLAPSGRAVDLDAVEVRYTPGSGPGAGQYTSLDRLTDSTKCAARPLGWHYDDSSPAKIVFCPKLCETAGADTAGRLEIAAGCKTPPPF